MFVLQHGRLKVKTTAEQEEAKHKERDRKLKLYTAGTSKVFSKVQYETVWASKLTMALEYLYRA